MAKTASELNPEVLDELLRDVKTEQDLNGVLRQLSKQLIERALEAEITEHLGHDKGGEILAPGDGSDHVQSSTRVTLPASRSR